MKNYFNEQVYIQFKEMVGIKGNVSGKGSEVVIGRDFENKPVTLTEQNGAIFKKAAVGDMFREGAYTATNLYKATRRAYNLVEYDDLRANSNAAYLQAAKRILHLNSVCKNGFEGQKFVGKPFIKGYVNLKDPQVVYELVDQYVDMTWI